VSYIAANYNTTVYQDSVNPWTLTFTFYTDDAQQEPLNLTGYSCLMVIGPPVNITLSSAGTYSDGLSLGDSTGVLTATLSTAQTCVQSSLAEPHYYVSLTPEAGPGGGIPVHGTLFWSAP
jgi:hypothetical protein